jgi:hypothetical protein
MVHRQETCIKQVTLLWTSNHRISSAWPFVKTDVNWTDRMIFQHLARGAQDTYGHLDKRQRPSGRMAAADIGPTLRTHGRIRLLFSSSRRPTTVP